MAYEADRRIIATTVDLKRQVRDKVTAFIERKWFGLGSWREADIDLFVAEIVPLVETGKKQVSQLTIAYLDAMARAAGHTPPLSPIVDLNVRGIDPDEQYRRSGVTVWTALSEKKHLNEAVRLGFLRLDEMLELDLQLAHTHTAKAWMAGADGIVGYRRVLTGFENCALCALASTQRYHRANLMPIHARCDCGVAPIYGTHDPGQVIDEEMYGALKEAWQDQYPDAFSAKGWESSNKPNSHIRVHMHGETGPTLTWANHGFTGPSDI